MQLPISEPYKLTSSSGGVSVYLPTEADTHLPTSKGWKAEWVLYGNGFPAQPKRVKNDKNNMKKTIKEPAKILDCAVVCAE